MLKDQEVILFDEPNLRRDFTFIDDVVAGIISGYLNS
jgi:hypothetical protein